MNAGNSQAKYPTVNVENPAGISVKDMLLNAVQNAEGQQLLESHLSIVRERYQSANPNRAARALQRLRILWISMRPPCASTPSVLGWQSLLTR